MLEGKITHSTFLYGLFSQSPTFVLDGKAKAAMTFLKNVFLNVLLNKLLVIKTLLLLFYFY